MRVSATVDIRLTCEVEGTSDADGASVWSLMFMPPDGADIDLGDLLRDKDVRRAAEEALRDAAADLRQALRAQARGGDE